MTEISLIQNHSVPFKKFFPLLSDNQLRLPRVMVLCLFLFISNSLPRRWFLVVISKYFNQNVIGENSTITNQNEKLNKKKARYFMKLAHFFFVYVILLSFGSEFNFKAVDMRKLKWLLTIIVFNHSIQSYNRFAVYPSDYELYMFSQGC